MKLGLREFLILSYFAVGFLACGGEKSLPIQIGMLPGKYCFNEGNNNDSLFLYNNRSYLHKYVMSETEVFATITIMILL